MQAVAILAYPNVLASSITLSAEILTAADQLQRSSQRSCKPLQILVATSTDMAVTSSSGLPVSPTVALADLHQADLLILPTLWRSPVKAVQHSRRVVVPLLQRLHRQGTLLFGIGTGTVFLAEAGLLDAKPATTHWFFMDEFSRRYPQVGLRRKHLITQSGNLFCAGSINSQADLTIHLVERFYGPSIARRVESQFSPEIRRSYRTHGYIEGEINRHDDEQITELQQWLHDNYQTDIDFRQQATALGLSQRSLNRRFKNATNITPVQYLQRLRLDQAKDLLRNTNLSIGEVAVTVGYNDPSYFALLFNKVMGMNPSRYRDSAKGKLFSTFD